MSQSLGEFEQFLLFALLGLDEDDRYGVPVRDEVERRTGRTLSAGAVYTALDRLSARGLVSSRLGEPTAERGGRRKRLYTIERPGIEALNHSVQQFRAMSRGLIPRLEALATAPGARGIEQP